MDQPTSSAGSRSLDFQLPLAPITLTNSVAATGASNERRAFYQT